MKKFKSLLRLIRKNSIIFSAAFMLALVVSNAGFLIYNNQVLDQTTSTQVQTQEIKILLKVLWDDVVRNLDAGVRGYALTEDESLLVPYNEGIRYYNEYHPELEAKLKAQGYPNMYDFQNLKKGFRDYLEISAEMVELVRQDELELFASELKKDRGLTLWRVYEKFASEVNSYQDALYSEATERYKAANSSMSYIQIILAIIGAPTLLFVIIRIRKGERNRRELFEELERNNREYIFNPGTSFEVNNEREVIQNSIINFKKAAHFISEVSAGNLKVDWEQLSEKNKALNEKNLAGELVHMREEMKELKQEDAKRLWVTEGQAKFSEIIRSSQHELQLLCDQTISFIVKYLEAQQGAVYLLQEEEDEPYLEMKGCYAFDRKKYIKKRIEKGQGLVGQAYLEKAPTMITEVPQDYTQITSGLGDTTPGCLLVVPLQYNEKVEAVLELASFQVFEEYQLEWVDKIGEIMASTLISIKTSEKSQKLLKQFQEQTEQLKSQEEELRQNMEEMEATQEEMKRKERELERRVSEGNN